MAQRENAKVVLVTCGSLAEARKIARSVVRSRLAACVNVISAPVESVYRWKGNVERAREFLLVIKTTSRRLKALEAEVSRMHSYEVPEFLVLRVDSGSKKYLAWLFGICRASPPEARLTPSLARFRF
jgi:periplasmic divalent cation tolerance protein